MGLLSWLSSPTREARRLLEAYAHEPMLHAAPLGALTPDQRRENLEAFVASIDGRIARLRAFTSALGTELSVPDGDRTKVDVISETLDRFAKSTLSGLHEIEHALAMDWLAQAPQGLARPVQTLAIDLGAYCGEVGIRCARQYRWVSDETRYTPSTIMTTAGRVVIGHDPAVIATPMTNHIDAIAGAGFALSQTVHFRTVKATGLWRPNYFHFLSPIADGRHS